LRRECVARHGARGLALGWAAFALSIGPILQKRRCAVRAAAKSADAAHSAVLRRIAPVCDTA